MNNRFKQFAALALLALSAGAFAACGSGGGESDTNGAEAELSGTVTVWDGEYEAIPEYTKAIDKVDANFEQLHPGVRVDRVAQPQVGYEPIYRAAFTARQGPDVMVFQPGALGVLSFTKGLAVLNDLLDPDLQDELTQWETVTPDYTADGEHYGVPVGVNGQVFYYNKKLFAKAGLPTDFEPASWDEVLEAGEKLKAAGVLPFSAGNKEGSETQLWFSGGFQTLSTPEQIRELGSGEMPYTDEAVANGFGPLLETYEAGLFPDDFFDLEHWSEGYVKFQEGKAGMAFGLWASAGYWKEFNPELGEDNVGMFFAPGTSSLGTTANIAYAIPKYVEDKDAALALLEYTASKEGAEILHDVGGYLPNRKDVPIGEDASSQERELREAFADRDLVTLPLAIIPANVAFGPMVTEISEVLQGRTSLEDAQAAMQEFAEKE